MELSFRKSEYGRELDIRGVRYTNYNGYGDKTEVFVGFVGEHDWDNKLEKFVLDGHLPIDRIVDKLLYEENVFSFFEDEEEMTDFIDSAKIEQCYVDKTETSYNAKRESRLLK